MLNEYHTKLSISLDIASGEHIDTPGALTTVISTELSDCSIHAWFQVFEQVLAMAGFSESVIMQGGAQLAFNERRSLDAMRSVAQLYDVRLNEDLDPIACGPGSAECA